MPAGSHLATRAPGISRYRYGFLSDREKRWKMKTIIVSFDAQHLIVYQTTQLFSCLYRTKAAAHGQ